MQSARGSRAVRMHASRVQDVLASSDSIVKDVPASHQAKARLALFLTEMIDIYPTLAQLCNLPKPDHVKGRTCSPCPRISTLQLLRRSVSHLTISVERIT